MDIAKELGANPVVISVLKKEYFNESVFEVMKKMSDKKICYVTLNKPAESIIKAFENRKIQTKNLFFIDAVSKSLGKKDLKNANFLSSPAALAEINAVAETSINSGFFDVMLIDSLSTLKNYIQDDNALALTTQITNKLKKAGMKGIFLCLEEDMSSKQVIDSTVDKVVSFRKFNENKENKKHIYSAAFIVIVVGLALVPFFNTANNITGFAVQEGGNAGPFNLIFSFMAVLLVVGFVVHNFFAGHERSLMKEYHLNLIRITSPLSSDRSLRDFSQKLSSWIKGA